jgi:hypothetical protein
MWKNFSPPCAIATSNDWPSNDAPGEPMAPLPASNNSFGDAFGPGSRVNNLRPILEGQGRSNSV